jgi:hypothetical protein
MELKSERVFEVDDSIWKSFSLEDSPRLSVLVGKHNFYLINVTFHSPQSFSLTFQ